ncbi:MAG: apolipoprotein N-acyltransferase, partial [Candidatus Hydrogenedentes bacterium]|nr:apolipoprotein N-acyltransferase [Candidatus Hydrogenedentota bacterium]
MSCTRLRNTLKCNSVAILCGAGLALAFPTYHLYPLAWFVLAPLLRQAIALDARAAAARFLVAGFVFHLVLLQWLMSNVYWAGGWAWWGYVALSLLLALFWYVTILIWKFVCAHIPWVPIELSFAVLWAAMEYVQSFAFTGFGWSAIAYSQAGNLSIAQWAAIGGAPLIGAIVAACNALIATASSAKRLRIVRIAAAVVVAAAAHLAGSAMMGAPDYAARPMKAALVQADFPLEMKWDPEYAVDMVRNAADKSRMLTNNERADLVVWPEALIMEDIETPGIIDEVSTLARDTGAYLFAGAHRRDPATGGSMNAAYLVDPDGVVRDYYDKIHLAPFGEYVPLSGYFPIIRKIVPAIGDIQHGGEEKTLLTGQRRLGPLICFEV